MSSAKAALDLIHVPVSGDECCMMCSTRTRPLSSMGSPPVYDTERKRCRRSSANSIEEDEQQRCVAPTIEDDVDYMITRRDEAPRAMGLATQKHVKVKVKIIDNEICSTTLPSSIASSKGYTTGDGENSDYSRFETSSPPCSPGNSSSACSNTSISDYRVPAFDMTSIHFQKRSRKRGGLEKNGKCPPLRHHTRGKNVLDGSVENHESLATRHRERRRRCRHRAVSSNEFQPILEELQRLSIIPRPLD